MPRSLRIWFRSKTLETHLCIALAAGLGLRLLSAFFVYGPQALDDYKHGVWPAYQFFAGLPVELPAYRSHLLIWYLSAFVRIAHWAGFDSALAQVRAMYMGLGLAGLSGIYGTYLYVRHFRSSLFGPAALYLVAFFPLMPFVSTRAFGEALAMSLVALGFGILEDSRKSQRGGTVWIAGFLSLGLATLLRFHVGLIYVVYLGVLACKREWRGLFLGLAAGAVTAVAAAGVDILSGKPALATLIAYLTENQRGAVKYGVSPWYNPLLFVLAVALAPFVLVLGPHVGSLWRRNRSVLLPALIFLAAHMLVPHKEERFLYPVLALEMWFVAYLWSCGALDRWARRIYSPVLFGSCLVFLPVTSLVNSQEGEIEPPAVIGQEYREVLFLDYRSLFGMSRFQFYFLRPPSSLEKVTLDELAASTVDRGLAEHREVRAVAFVTSESEGRDRLLLLEGLSTMEGRCLSVRRSGSWVDQALFTLNPKHNQRRRPSWYLVCERRET